MQTDLCTMNIFKLVLSLDNIHFVVLLKNTHTKQTKNQLATLVWEMISCGFQGIFPSENRQKLSSKHS